MRPTHFLWAAAILLMVAVALLSPTTDDPDEQRVVPRFLAEMGFQVAEGEDLPSASGTLIRLQDLGGPDDAQLLLAWAARGGNLVLADPDSLILPQLGAAPAAPIGFVGTVNLEPHCVAPQAVGVARLAVRAGDVALRAEDDAWISCFPTQDGAFLLTREYGEGTVTLLGGASPLTSALLAEADNAVLAVQLAAPDQEVVFGGPTGVGAPGVGAPGTGGVWEALPDQARAGVIGIVAAAVAFALVRARRLGRPVLEDPITPIPASELVRAAGRMYHRAGAAAYCGRLLREAVVDRLSRRIGGGRDIGPMLARASGMTPERVEEILRGPDAANDADLINLGRDLEELVARAQTEGR